MRPRSCVSSRGDVHGLTIANVVGVPLATWAGEHLGWRASFWGIAGLGVATMAALRLTLPELPAPAGSDAMAELRALTRGPVLGALALTVIASSAMFTVFTYIAPILREATQASLSAVLVAFALLMGHAWASVVLIFLWGIASFALVPPLQMRVMSAASDEPNLASAVNIGAFNLGNAFAA